MFMQIETFPANQVRRLVKIIAPHPVGGKFCKMAEAILFDKSGVMVYK